MENIKNIVHQVMDGLAAKKPETQDKIQKLWQEAVGDKGRRHTQVADLTNGRLIIYVDSPAWLFQLKLKQRKILENIRRGMSQVQEVYFKIGKIDKR